MYRKQKTLTGSAKVFLMTRSYLKAYAAGSGRINIL